MICEEKQRYNIDSSDIEIQQMSKRSFNELINSYVNNYAFSKLLSTAQTQSKCTSALQNNNYNEFKIQKYLISENLVKEEQSLLFSLRTFNFPVKSNFRYKYKQDVLCRACGDPDSD